RLGAGVEAAAAGGALRAAGPAAVAGAPGRNGRPRRRARIGLAFNRKPDEGTTAPPALSGNGSGRSHADLYAEWDDEVTIAALEVALAEAGQVIRLEATAGFPERLPETNPGTRFNAAERLWGPNPAAHGRPRRERCGGALRRR